MARFLLISTLTADPWGGSEELWAEAGLRLLGAGHEVYVSVQRWPQIPAKVQKLIEAGAKVHFRDENKSLANRALRKVKRDLMPGVPSDATDAFIRASVPDLVLISMGNYLEDSFWMAYCQKRSIPYTVVAHVVGEHAIPDDSSSSNWASLYEGAQRFWTDSERGLANIRRQLAIPLTQGRVVRNPYNVRRNTVLEWPDDSSSKLAMVARLDPPTKGQDIIFEVMAQSKWRERGVTLSVYGEGPGQQTLRRLKQMLNLENVEFKGTTSDLEGLWAEHHALALPSRIEGLPLALVEAMTLARVCIVTDVAGNAELIEDGFTGFVATAPHPAAFDAALERAWQRRSDWQAIGKLAREGVLRLIPDDPAEVFAQELVSIKSSPKDR